MHNQRGYILVMTVLIIAAAAVVVSVIFTRGSVFNSYADTMIKREQARMLALGGIAIARAQLAQLPEREEKEEKKDSSGDEEAEKKLFLKTILPSLNLWQFFDLTSQEDGIDGQVAISLTSEDGKIDLNKIRDKDGAIDKKWQPILSDLAKRFDKEAGKEGLYTALEKYFKEHKEPLCDVTELLSVPAFSLFRDAIIYEPPAAKKKVAAEKKKRPLYLTDIFTVHGSDTLEPWLFSDSIAGLLGLSRAGDSAEKERKKQVDTIVKDAKMTAEWARDWDNYLKPLYGKELQSLPKNIESVLNKQFSPNIFSVISEGTVGKVTQRLLALVHRQRRAGADDRRYYEVIINRLYWL